MSTRGNKAWMRWAFAAALSIWSASGGPWPAQAAPGSTTAASGADYDATWWRTIGSKEKFGFILGVEQCQLLDMHKMVGIVAIEPVEVAMMDKFADETRAQSPHESMAQAWEDMTTTKYRATSKDVDDFYASSEDYEFWNGREEVEYHRGFLEGHIACRVRHGALRWSKPIDYYVGKFDRIYSPAAKPAPADSGARISSVLTKLADPR